MKKQPMQKNDEGYVTVWVTRMYDRVLVTLTRPKVVTDGAKAYRIATDDANRLGGISYSLFSMLQPDDAQRPVKLAHGAQKEVNIRLDAYHIAKLAVMPRKAKKSKLFSVSYRVVKGGK